MPDLAKRPISTLGDRWIKLGAHANVSDLDASVRAYRAQHNDDPQPFVWPGRQARSWPLWHDPVRVSVMV